MVRGLLAEPDYVWPSRARLGTGRVEHALRFWLSVAAGALGWVLGRAIAWSRKQLSRPVQKVLVLRTDAVGDLVLFTGALRALRELFPKGRITLMVPRECSDLARCGLPVDRYLFICQGAKRGALRLRYDPVERLRVMLRLMADDYDLAVYGAYAREPVGNFLLQQASARRRVAFRGNTNNQFASQRDRSVRSFDLVVESDPSRPHELDRYGELIRALGGDERCVRLATAPRLVAPPDVQRRARDRIESIREKYHSARAAPGLEAELLGHSRPKVVGVAPGSMYEIKRWPVERFAELLDRIAGRVQLVAVALGVAGERHLGEYLCERLAGRLAVRNLCGRMSLAECIALIGEMDALVGNDTSLLHVGVAQNVPTIAIVGGGHFGQFHPWGDRHRHRVVHVPMDCYGCNWRCIHPEPLCIRQITVASVLAELEDILCRDSAERRCVPAPRQPAHA